MKYPVAIRREDLSKTGEKRVAVTPELSRLITRSGHRLLVQPAQHPESGELKRAFPDEAYAAVGAEISEDISAARIVFGLKEVETAQLMPDKTWLMFSHTHKGQKKNRPMLRALMAQRATLIDYELIANAAGQRMLTAFTYVAGYAGMIDSLWALGQRYAQQGISHPLQRIPQAIETEDLEQIKTMLREVGEEIRREGTPPGLPPLIAIFLGSGKTSTGAQSIYDLLPVQEISPEELPEVFLRGSRHAVYKLVLDIPQMFRPRPGTAAEQIEDDAAALRKHYMAHPGEFESNMEAFFPYASLWMNCVLWSPRFPQLISRADAARWYAQHQTLAVIGDISCDPEGAIGFSRETWIDHPVFVYDPFSDAEQPSPDMPGIVVMAIANLPCEFSADASAWFSRDLEPWLPAILHADYEAESVEQSGLPEELRRAVILWKGQFSAAYAYMAEFLQTEAVEA